jgi:hypothetical protein
MKEHAIVMGHLSPCEDTNSLAVVPSTSKQKKELRPRSKQIHYSEFPEFDMMSSDSEGKLLATSLPLLFAYVLSQIFFMGYSGTILKGCFIN